MIRPADKPISTAWYTVDISCYSWDERENFLTAGYQLGYSPNMCIMGFAPSPPRGWRLFGHWREVSQWKSVDGTTLYRWALNPISGCRISAGWMFGFLLPLCHLRKFPSKGIMNPPPLGVKNVKIQENSEKKSGTRRAPKMFLGT